MPRSSGSERDIRENICPRCGGPAPDGGLCGACRGEGLTWLSCDGRVRVISCPVCGAVREAGIWTDFERTRDDLARDAVRRGVHIAPEVTGRSVTIAIRETSVNRSIADVDVAGTLHGRPVTGTCQVEIAHDKEQCDRCSRISGSYYEGIVQVRARGRKPRAAEILAAGEIAREVEESCLAGGERLSYISETEETKDGLDITVGSQRIGQEIASEIVRRMGGRFTTHPKLVGEKAGRRLYRITYSVRLSPFTKGDVIVIRGRYGVVVSIGGKGGLRYRGLDDGTLRTARENQVEHLVGNERDAHEFLVTYRHGRSIGLLDPDNGESLECQLPGGLSAEPGKKVRVIRDGDRIVLLHAV